MEALGVFCFKARRIKMKVRVLLLMLVLLVVTVVPVAAAGPSQSEAPEVEFSAQAVSAIVGFVISLLFSYFPRLNTAYAGLSTEAKSLIMIGLMVLVTGAIVLLDYFDVINAGLTFDKGGIMQIVMTFIAALMANQATYVASPQTRAVKEARLGKLENFAGKLHGEE
jgi:membrane-associated HD superfamily phosphohydrolase